MKTPKTIRIGLAGNPNTGKTTLFNAITGAHQKTGNYAGVTVEKKEGRIEYNGIEFIVVDLPGTYSLTAYSLDEVVARDFVLNDKPDIIVDVLDATNLERNLYLCLQFQELDIPVVGALNMTDQAEKNGIVIDAPMLEKLLGIPMVMTVGSQGRGVEKLLNKIIEIMKRPIPPSRTLSYGTEVEAELLPLAEAVGKDSLFSGKISPRWMAIKLLEKDSNARERLSGHTFRTAVERKADEAVARIEKHFGRHSDVVVAEQRYAYIHGALTETVRRIPTNNPGITEKIDRVLMNRFLGLPIFLGILWLIFQITFKAGEIPMGWLQSFFGFLSSTLSAVMPDGILKSLVIDGIIGGVGGVLSFVPLIIILFMLLSIMEDTGYMARAAFIMDKFLHIFGLHGQSFMPMMLGFGCSVPAVMASRSLKNPRDRIITILVTPFMSCGAKLPVHVLLAAAFFPKHAGNMVMLIYLIGVTLALLSALLFRKTVLKGEATPFVMELPPYRMPTLRGILWHVWDKTSMYLKKAGTVLLAASILIWAVTTFPKPAEDPAKYEKIAAEYRAEILPSIQTELSNLVSGKTDLAALENDEAKAGMEQLKARILSGSNTFEAAVSERADSEVGIKINTLQTEAALENSIAGRIGKWMEPAFRPIGFDWKIAISAITGFAAKEAVVSTLGVLYKVGTEESENSLSLQDALRADPHWNPLVAFVLMLFTLVIAPCFAALSAMNAEAGWKWTAFFIGYSIALSWLLCFSVFQIGRLFGIGV